MTAEPTISFPSLFNLTPAELDPVDHSLHLETSLHSSILHSPDFSPSTLTALSQSPMLVFFFPIPMISQSWSSLESGSWSSSLLGLNLVWCHGFKYCLPPSLPLNSRFVLDIPTWMFKRFLKLNVSGNKFLISLLSLLISQFVSS